MCRFVWATGSACCFVVDANGNTAPQEKSHFMDHGAYVLQKCGHAVQTGMCCPNLDKLRKPPYKEIIDPRNDLLFMITSGRKANRNVSDPQAPNADVEDLTCSVCRMVGVTAEGCVPMPRGSG